MASLVLNGNTSGSVTISSPAVSGTTTITLPTVSGGNFVVSDSSGNVGIGTTSPTQKLHVFATNPSILTEGAVPGISFKTTQSGNREYRLVSGYQDADSISLVDVTASNAQRLRIDSSGNLLFNSGYGSVATAYGCRAWVKFNGTGTVAINGSGNVSSITDHGTGDYTINFSTSMPDANYSTVALGDGPVNGQHCQAYVAYGGIRSTYSTSGVAVSWFNATNSAARADPAIACITILR